MDLVPQRELHHLHSHDDATPAPSSRRFRNVVASSPPASPPSPAASSPDAWLALHVYEKCGSKLETHWPRGGWARERRSWIQNKGEECYAYLSYITTWWKHLPEYVVFFQGDGVLNGERFRSKLQMWGAEVVATGMVDAWRSVNDHQYISVAPTQAACDAARRTR